MSAQEFFARVGLHGEPVADPSASVVHGETRFTILTPRLIRIEWAPDGAFDDRATYAFPTRRAPVPPFHLRASGETLTIDTGALRLQRIGMRGPHTSDNLSLELPVAGRIARWTPGTPDPLNLRGARRTLDGCHGQAAIEPGLLSRSGWALHDDSAAVRFDPRTGWVQPRPEPPRQDWYFFGYGHDFRGALAEYARFGGAVPLIPRWALGAWWSRYYAYSEQELRDLAAAFAAHDFPLDVLVIDMDWHTPHGWTGYTWNTDLFADPSAFLAWLHEQGLRVTLNLHPADGVQPHEAVYPAFAAAMEVEPGQGVPFRIGDARFARNYFHLLHHPLEDQGVDFWWIDWQQGRACEVPGLDPLPWLNHLHFSDMRRRRDRRPIILSRWGGLGNHRYPVGFSGDTYATWEALRFQPYFTASAANVLYGWWSHDIGGHFDAAEPELYTRWVQFGAFSPILRLHSTKDLAAERRPWAFPPAARDAARAAFQARYALLPYLYTLARIHTDTGLAPCRPLYYEWPDAEAAYVAREQFALGDQIIVAPIVHPSDPSTGLAPADVWVPPGEWIERASGERFRGPAWMRLVGDLHAIPQLVRAGGILPLAPVTSRSHQQAHDRLILAIFPGEHGMLRLYEDAGEGEAYRQNEYEWTPVEARSADGGRTVEVSIGPAEGHCPALPPERAITVRFEHCRPPTRVWLDGREHAGWRYDAATQTIIVDITARPRTISTSLVVQGDAPLTFAGDERNAALRLADARRLLRLPDAASETLLAAALAGDTAAHRHALARLGGPFARVFEYTTPEDAARTLGALVVAAPRDGAPVRVAGHWRLHGPGGVAEIPCDPGDLYADTIVYAPFAWDGSSATCRWSLDLRLHWRGHAIAYSFTSATLFPAVSAWRTLATPAISPLSLDALLDLAGAPRRELPWDHHTLASAPDEMRSLTEPFPVPLSQYARANRDAALVGYAVAELRAPTALEARVAYQSPRLVRVWLNGVELMTESFTPCAVNKVNPRWSRTIPATLRPGANVLLIASDRPAGEEPWFWFLHVAIVGPDGLPAPEVAVVTPHLP
ncbi:MAG: glycoside hydrolase family 31 protein [Oscillochloridaceae bacterium]|nr:DUF5110 domain-containing protein [Chloroflexaceae bacterium]MDW8390512.1 glycoside hydrolase family 31 protein [Oscillochloridaceae bacterium]